MISPSYGHTDGENGRLLLGSIVLVQCLAIFQ